MTDPLKEFYESNIPQPLRYIAEKLWIDENYIKNLSSKGAQEELKALQKKHGYTLNATLDSDLTGFSRTKSSDDLAKHAPENFKDFYKNYAQDDKDTIKKLLEPSASYNTALNNYKSNISKINDMIKEVPARYKAQDFIGLVKDVNNDLKKSLIEQHKAELAAVNNSDLPDKARIKTDLETAQKKELEKLDEINKTQQTQLHNSAMFEQRQKLALLQLCKGNAAMTKIVEELAEENRINANKDNPTSAKLGNTNTDPHANVKLDQLTKVASYSGHEIKLDNGKFSFQQGPSGLLGMIPGGSIVHGLMNRFKRADSVSADGMTIAMILKAKGYQEVDWDVNYEKQEDAQEAAMKLVRVSLLNGFAPDQIHLTVNGQKKTVNEVFKGFESRLQDAKSEAEGYEKIREKNEKLPPLSADNVKKMKAELAKEPTTAKEDDNTINLNM